MARPIRTSSSTPGFDQQAFFEWAAANGLGPGFTERNGYNTGWSSRFDLRISQEIPLPADLVGRVYFKVYNLGNMLNSDWGEIVDAQFFTPEIVDASVDAQGRFVFEEFSESFDRAHLHQPQPVGSPSRLRHQVRPVRPRFTQDEKGGLRAAFFFAPLGSDQHKSLSDRENQHKVGPFGVGPAQVIADKENQSCIS